MTPSEIAAFNAGIRAVTALARSRSADMAPRVRKRPTTLTAIRALDALADAEANLLIALPVATVP